MAAWDIRGADLSAFYPKAAGIPRYGDEAMCQERSLLGARFLIREGIAPLSEMPSAMAARAK
jgi:hypothetical protein